MSNDATQLLVVEDDPELQRQLRWSLERFGPIFAGSREEAVDALRRHEPAVVLLDLGLPPEADGIEEGMQALQQILQLLPGTKVIVVTGNGDETSALRAIGLGAHDFYQKPVDIERLKLMLDRALYVSELEARNRNERLQAESPLDGLIASSRIMKKVCRLVEKVAPTDATTLLLGDTGAGKEVFARAIHRLSPRGENRFVAINCAAIPENLLEAELFGYEKGAYTGAAKQTLGKIELAHEGTLFLDEIGDMPAQLQAKLLRFLQERTVERVGGRKEIPVDVRVVCATHRDLRKLIESGEFREDIYYRLAEVTVEIPPLRERDEDIVLIARAFFENAMQAHGARLNGFAPDAISAMSQYDWPGNVRELEHRVNRAVIMADGKFVTAEDLGLESGEEDQEQGLELNLRQVRDSAERSAVQRSLSMADGNVSRAARLLGISRPACYDLIKKHDLK